MPIDWGIPIAAGVSAVGSALKDGKKQVSAEVPSQYSRKRLVESFAKQYPELKGLTLPGIAPEAIRLVSMLMTGKLPTGVSEALGLGAETEYGTAMAGMPAGAGPMALAKMKAGIMGRLGASKAMMGFGGMQVGLKAAPQISELMMQPQKWGAEEQRRRWMDITGMYSQYPTGAFLKQGQQVPGLKAPGYGIPTYKMR